MSFCGMPDDVIGHHLDVLVLAAVVVGVNISDQEVERRVHSLDKLLRNIMRKKLSDSPNLEERKRFAVEILETALKIAKGELVPWAT